MGKKTLTGKTANISRAATALRVTLLSCLSATLLATALGQTSSQIQTLPQEPRLYAPHVPVPDEFFGMHINHLLSGNEPNAPTPWPSVKFTDWRLWDVRATWTDLEPAPGQWKFEVLDKLVDLARQHNVEVQLTFGFTPAWASARPTEDSLYRPGGAAEPKDLKAWDDYVRTVATRYRGRIHIYEIWNEPNVKRYWSGTPAQLAELARHAHDIIKQIDPSTTLVGPSPTGDGGVAWLSSFLDAGGGKAIGVVGFHFYVFPAGPEAMVPLIKKVRGVMKAHDAGDKPLWDTETGWAKPAPFPSEELAADYLARAYFLTWASDVRRFYWYAWDNHSWVSLQTTKNDNQTLTPAGKAYDVVQRWLTGKTMEYCEVAPDKTWECKIAGKDEAKKEWIIWNPDHKACWKRPADADVTRIDPLLSEPYKAGKDCIEAREEPQLLRHQ